MKPKLHATRRKLSGAVILAALLLLVVQLPATQVIQAAASLFEPTWPTVSNNTEGASTVVGPNGATHMAFSGYTAVNGVYPAYYAYCATNCSSAANWLVTPVGDTGGWGGNIRLELDSAGRLHMLWFSMQAGSSFGWIQYAECSSGCTKAANWKVTSLTSVSIGPDRGRYFAVDPQGHPRFLYTDTATEHRGTFYAYCDSNCTVSDNWYETQFSNEYLYYDFSLAFSPAGAPQFAYRDATGSQDVFVYAACDSSCTVPDAWQKVILVDQIGSGSAVSLDVDSKGRPRLAYYSGYLSSENPANDLLSYGYCNTNCFQAASWTIRPVKLPTRYGDDVDLVIDAQNRPHMAYYIDATDLNGLGYIGCSSNCESSAPTWKNALVESSDELDAIDPIPAVSGCSLSFWLENGIEPSLALDSSGKPRVGYTAVHYQGGTCTIHEDVRLVRFAQAGNILPPVLGANKVYIPAALK